MLDLIGGEQTRGQPELQVQLMFKTELYFKHPYPISTLPEIIKTLL